jgi:hypothetical protein
MYWENEPSASFPDAAKWASSKVNCQTPAGPSVSARARDEGWVKLETVKGLAKRSVALADRLVTRKKQSSNPFILPFAEGDDPATIRAVIINAQREDTHVLRLDLHRDIEALRPQNLDAYVDLLVASENEKRMAQALVNEKPPVMLSELDKLRIRKQAQGVIQQRISTMHEASMAFSAIHQSERKTYGLDEVADGEAQFTDEDRAKLDALYVEAIDSAQKGAEVIADRMRQIQEMVAAGSSGSVQ